MNNKIAIQMDDIRTIDYAFDSSFMIGLEGQKRNYEILGGSMRYYNFTINKMSLTPILNAMGNQEIDTKSQF